jgi:hypothetical protein
MVPDTREEILLDMRCPTFPSGRAVAASAEASPRSTYQHGEDGQIRHVDDALRRGHGEAERERHEAADAKSPHDEYQQAEDGRPDVSVNKKNGRPRSEWTTSERLAQF